MSRYLIILIINGANEEVVRDVVQMPTVLQRRRQMCIYISII